MLAKKLQLGFISGVGERPCVATNFSQLGLQILQLTAQIVGVQNSVGAVTNPALGEISRHSNNNRDDKKAK
jgi:hypothetical protein